MATDLCKSGIDVVGDIPWGTHFCYFYDTKQDLLDVLIPYFKTGLENKEYCLWVISNSELLTVEEATSALRTALPDLDRYMADKSIEVIGHAEWFLNGDSFDPQRVATQFKTKLDEALARGHAGMRVNGSPAWLHDAGQKDLREFEEQLDKLFPYEHTIASCTYPLGAIGGDQVFDVVSTHHFAIARRQGQWQVIQSPELIQAKAEIKQLNEDLQRIVKKAPQPPFILRYVVAILAVTTALIINRLLNINLVGAPAMLFLCSIMFSAWFGGAKPALLATPLAVMAFAYYFVTPYNSWVIDVREIPRLLLFVMSAVFVISLSTAQKRAAEALRRARDFLEGTVDELKRTNQALRTENTERGRAEEALRKSEDHLRLVVDTTPMMSWSLRPDGTVDFLSQRWVDYAGLSLEQYVKDPMGPIHPDDVSRVIEKWLVAKTAGEAYEDEMRLQGADGKYRWFLVRTAPLKDVQGNVVKWYGVSIDIEDRKRVEDRLRETTKHLRALSARFQSAKEEEGTRIAREIHDELGAALTSLRWDLESFDKSISELGNRTQVDTLRERIGGMMSLTETAVGTVRRISSELRPTVLDDLGLAAAIEWQAEEFQNRTGIICRCDFSSENLNLSRDQSTAVFRIFQEALTNILRHAKATRVDIAIKAEESEFVLDIRDNGRGITDSERTGSRSLGLMGMRERTHLIGGEFRITGTDGKGTGITIRIPVSGE